jgi:RHS repeat-associated protein
MKERSWQSDGYRYGFNGKENDADWEVQDYGFRIYKPEISKFLSVDPLTQSYPWYTPYQFAGNMPINSIDVDGAEELNAVLGIKVYTGYPQTKISFSASITGALNSRTASNVPNIISPEGGLRIEANYYAQMFASGPGIEATFSWYAGLGFGDGGFKKGFDMISSEIFFAGSGQQGGLSAFALGFGQSIFKGKTLLDSYSTSQKVGAFYARVSIGTGTGRILTTNDLSGMIYAGDNADRLRTAGHSISYTKYGDSETHQFGLAIETQTDHPVPNKNDPEFKPNKPWEGPFVTDKEDLSAGRLGTYQTTPSILGSINRNMIRPFYNYSGAKGSLGVKIGVSTPSFDTQKWIHYLLKQGNFKKESTRPSFEITTGTN